MGIEIEPPKREPYTYPEIFEFLPQRPPEFPILEKVKRNIRLLRKILGGEG